MTDTPDPARAQPGWYPDPAEPNGRRYWDGAAWTEHVAPLATAWGAPSGTGWQQPAGPTPHYQPGPAMPAGPYQAYAPIQAPLAPSRLRRISELFADAGRIIKHAWWQIIAVSLGLWLVWGVIAGIVSAILVNVGNLIDALTLTFETSSRYSTGRLPAAVSQQLADAWEQVPRTQSVAVWVVASLALVVLSLVIACFQLAAVNRLAMDAAAGQPVSLGRALRSAPAGGVRLLGYSLLAFVVVTIAVGLLVGLAFLMESFASPLGVLFGILGFLALSVLWVWVVGRLIPLAAQAVANRGALRWSWNATRGKFWAVVGRYLLWSLIASVLGQFVISALTVPVSLLAGGGAATGSSGVIVATSGLLYLVSITLSMALSAITYIGVVPIWRDLTDDPVYRSIGPDGLPVPHPD